MVTRFRFPEDAITAPITPSPHSDWEDTSIFARRWLSPNGKPDSGLSDITFPDDGDNTSKDILFRQYISPELTAGQTFTGGQSWRVQCRVLEPSSGGNMFLTVGLRIIASDGSTTRKTAVAVTRDNTESASAGTLTNRGITGTTAATNYTTQSGDRLVLEIGMGGDPGASDTHESTMRLGCSTGNDLGANDTDTTDLNPWLELTDNLTFVETNVTKTIGTSSRDYSTLTSFEAALTNANFPTPYTHLTGDVYNDSTFDEDLLLSYTASNLSQITIQGASGERHDGTAGTGARIVATSTGRRINFDAILPPNGINIQWLEVNNNGLTAAIYPIRIYSSTIVSSRISHNIVHNIAGVINGNFGGISMYGATNGVKSVHNNIVYKISTSYSSFAAYVTGIYCAGLAVKTANNTVDNIKMTHASATGNVRGMVIFDAAGGTMQNNLITEVTKAGAGGTQECFDAESFSNATVSHNAASDTTASGTGSLDSVVRADQYVSITGGSEDYHLTTGADAIGAGTDLGTTPTGVNLDIDGEDRDALAVTWSIGADQETASTDATGTIAVTIGAATAALSAEHDVPVFTGAIASTIAPATAALVATFSVYTYSATIAVSQAPATAALTAEHTVPTYTGTITVAMGAAVGEMTAEFDQPVYTGSIAATIGPATAALLAEVDNPVYAATVAVSAAPATTALSATFANAVFSATIGVTTGPADGDLLATHTVPTYTGSIAVTVGAATSQILAEFDQPTFSATIGVTIGAVICSMAGTFTASGAILTPTTIIYLVPPQNHEWDMPQRHYIYKMTPQSRIYNMPRRINWG